MNNIGLVTSAGIKNAFRNKIVLIILVPITLICVVGVALLACLLLIGPEVASESPDRAALAGHLNLILYSCILISIGVTLNSLVFQTMIKEKSRGNLAALLATPLKVSEIWLGKSLALFLPGLVMGIVLAVLSWVIVNVIYFSPDIGFIFNFQMVVNSLVLLPLMYLFFGMLVHLVGLTAKPTTGNVIAQVYLPVIANVMIQLVVRGVMDANSWHFMVLNFGIAAIFCVIVLAVRSRLTPERVILSAG